MAKGITRRLPPRSDAEPSRAGVWSRRVGWLVVLWLLGVGALGVAALALKAVMRLAGLSA